MNDCKFLGRATSDIELRQTPSGKSVCKFTIAVKRKYSKDVTDFIRCNAWDKTAETISRCIKKGTQFIVMGELQSNQYEDKDGKKQTSYEIKVNEFEFVDSRTGNSSQVTSSGYEGINTPSETKTPQSAKIQASEPQFEAIDNDGDLPF